MPAKAGGIFETIDPGNGRSLARIAAETTDVEDAVQAAHEAFHHSGWATMPSNDRAVILHRLADLVDQHTAILAQLESLDVGKPIALTVAFDVPNCAQTLRYYADLSVHSSRAKPLQFRDARLTQLGFRMAFVHSSSLGISHCCYWVGGCRRR